MLYLHIILVTKNRERTKEKSQKSRNRNRRKSKSKYNDVEYHYCGKKGRIKRNCFKGKREKIGSTSETKEDSGNDHVITTTLEDLLLVYDDGVIN